MSKQPLACDPQRIELFLCQELSNEEQDSFESHLDDCAECRQRLETMAADERIWSGVLDALQADDAPAECVPTIDGPLDSATDEEAPFDHKSVLARLAPTDDDRMMGRLGSYEVVGVVGSGGMGVVLKAFDSTLNRYVAIKVLAPHLGNSGGARKRFSREAQAAAAVVHDNVIEIHSVSDTAGLPYLVMPYVRGPSLQRRLDKDGPLAVVEILRIGMQAASGLAAAHEQGLVHRDVKPANILLANGVERVKLTDFGLARAADDASVTRTGIIAGTPQYMSPEQRRGEQVDQRSDLFSLGSVLYAMCTGRAPFRAETSYGVLRRVTDQQPRSIREINPEIPDWLCQIIARLMAKQPDERLQSASEVAELLKDCLAHVQQPTTVPLPASVKTHSKDRRFVLGSRRTLGVVVMITALGLGLLGIAGWQATQAPDISGTWTGEQWGTVQLESAEQGHYTGTYSAGPVVLQVKWSRVERRFNGKWTENGRRGGEISLRLVEGEIRGAWRMGDEQEDAPRKQARLADLLWTRGKSAPSTQEGPADTVGLAPRSKNVSAPKLARRYSTPTSGNNIKIGLSPNGRLIAVADTNPTRIMMGGGRSRTKDNWQSSVVIMDAESGKIIVSLQLSTPEEDAVLAGPERISYFEASALAFSPDSSQLAVGTSHGQVKIFNTDNSKPIRSLDDEPFKLADENTPENWKTLRRAMGSVVSIAYSPDGKLLPTCGTSFADFAEQFDSVSRMGFRATGPGRLKLWDATSGALIKDLEGHNNNTNALAYSPNGHYLASAGRWLKDANFGNGVKLWNGRFGNAIRSFKTTANGGTRAIVFSPDSKMLAIGTQRFEGDSSTGGVSLVNVSSGVTRWLVTVPGWAKPLAFLPDSSSIAVLCGEQSLRFLAPETGKTIHEIKPTSSAQNVRWDDFAIAGRVVAIAAVAKGKKGSIEIWKLPRDENQTPPAAAVLAEPPTTTPKEETDKDKLEPTRRFVIAKVVRVIACSEDARLVAIADCHPKSSAGDTWEPSVDVLDARTGNKVTSLALSTAEEQSILSDTKNLMQYEVTSLTFSHDTHMIAVGTNHGQVKLFHPRTGKFIRTLDDEPDRLADQNTPESWRALKRAVGSVTAMAFSPDGSMLATGGRSFDDFARVFSAGAEAGPARGALKLWDTKTGALKHDLTGHSQVNSVAFSPDGKTLSSAGRWLRGNAMGSGVIVWDAVNGNKTRTLSTNANGGAHTVAYSPDGQWLAYSSSHVDVSKENDPGTVEICVAQASSGLVQWQRRSPGFSRRVAFYSEANSLVVLCDGETMRYIEGETGQTLMGIVPQTALGGTCHDFVIVNKGQTFAIGGATDQGRGSVEVWDFSSN